MNNTENVTIENLQISLQELEGASLVGPLEEEYRRYDRVDFPMLNEICVYLRKDHSLDEFSELEVDFSLWSQDIEEINIVGDGPFTADNQVFVVCCEHEVVAIQIV